MSRNWFRPRTRTYRPLNAGYIDLKQVWPELPRQEQPVPDRVECDAVRDGAPLGYILAFRCGQQIHHINYTIDQPGCTVDSIDDTYLSTHCYTNTTHTLYSP